MAVIKYVNGDNLARAFGKVAAMVTASTEGKQDKLTGNPGQVVGFDADGNPVAQDNQGASVLRTWTDADMT